MKNLIIFFTTVVILLPSFYSSALISKRDNHEKVFMDKFKNTYEFRRATPVKTYLKQTKKQQFENLFEKVRKQ